MTNNDQSAGTTVLKITVSPGPSYQWKAHCSFVGVYPDFRQVEPLKDARAAWALPMVVSPYGAHQETPYNGLIPFGKRVTRFT